MNILQIYQEIHLYCTLLYIVNLMPKQYLFQFHISSKRKSAEPPMRGSAPCLQQFVNANIKVSHLAGVRS